MSMFIFLTITIVVDISVGVHENILLLFNSDESTQGTYTCLATNMEGQDTKNYEITVQGKKKN